MYDDFGYEELVTIEVTIADIPTLVILPMGDLFGAEGESIQFSAPTRWLDLRGQPDNTATVNLSTIEWNWQLRTSGPDSVTGQLAPTHLYNQSGYHVAEVLLTDSQGNIGSAAINVHVYEVPPTVSAGSDITVQAGVPVVFTGTAYDYSGIHTAEWDFDYDGETVMSLPGLGLTTTVYDKADKLVRKEDAAGGVWTTTYDKTRVLSTTGRGTRGTPREMPHRTPPRKTCTSPDSSE